MEQPFVRWSLPPHRFLTPDERRLIPIIESGEPLVDVASYCPGVVVQLRIEPRRQYAGGNKLYARSSVCDRLNGLAELVGPSLLVHVFDAYRPLDYQRWRYNQVKNHFARDQPHLTEEELEVVTDRFVALPSDDPAVPPPHATGAALDMLLVHADGTEPDYGSPPSMYTNDFTSKHMTHSELVTAGQRSWRLALLEAAEAVGFANYPGEWWHYSFGDQEWCYQTKSAATARFGRVEAPRGE